MRKIITLGVSAFSAAALTFGAVGTASAAEPTLVDAVCKVLPASATSLLEQLTARNAAVTTTASDLVTKKAALQTAIDALVPAVVNHVQAVSSGSPSAGTAGILTDASAGFANKVVAANNAMTASFEAQRTAYLTDLNSRYVSGVKDGLCS